MVEGDYIGTNAAGNASLGSGSYGVYLGNAASSNLIGGSAPGTADVIVGNSTGVEIVGTGTKF